MFVDETFEDYNVKVCNYIKVLNLNNIKKHKHIIM